MGILSFYAEFDILYYESEKYGIVDSQLSFLIGGCHTKQSYLNFRNKENMMIRKEDAGI